MRVDEYVRARPSPAVRRYAAWYSGYRQVGLPAGTHRGLPSPYPTLIFTMDEPLTVVAHPDPRQAPGRYDALLGGLHLSPAMITHDGRQSGVQVAVDPLGCRDLLGMPAGDLAGVDVDAADVLGPVAAEVRDRLRHAGTWAARFAVVDAALLGLVRRRTAREAGQLAPEVTRVWHRLLGAGGAVPVTELVAEVGWSPRHLGTRFRAETGLNPKAAARVDNC